jgi:hypothetical protein
MEDSKKSGIAKLKKLGLTDEEINAMLGVEEEIPPEEELALAEDNEMDRLNTTWQGIFLLEQLEYYNNSIGGKGKGARASTEAPIKSLAEFVEKIQSGEIEVHFDWKALTETPLTPTTN